ncbi:MAG: acylphosphatase [Firmicutes bacterium]|nr:acylphosphatase [Bacillota bacterium]
MQVFVRRHLYISGRVQGVGFRAFILQHARKNGVNGWVKNTYDGKVEAVFSGGEDKVTRLIKLAKKGPRWARVENIEIRKEDYQDEFEEFTVKY